MSKLTVTSGKSAASKAKKLKPVKSSLSTEFVHDSDDSGVESDRAIVRRTRTMRKQRRTPMT